MTLQSLYEQDKERLISQLSGADRQGVIRIISSELDRILYAFNDAEEEPEVRAAAASMISTAKASAALVDTAGVTRIYGRREYRPESGEEKGKGRISVWFWILLAAGLLCACPLAVMTVRFLTQMAQGAAEAASADSAGTGGGISGPLRTILLVAPFLSMLLLFLAGWRLRRKEVKEQEKLQAEVLTDPMKVWHGLMAAVLVMDKNLEEIRSRAALAARQQTAAAGPDEEELGLLSEMLEDAYARRQTDEQAEEEISRIRYYLHRKQIDTTDWAETDNEEQKYWFDMMPAYEAGTIRPALVRDGQLLKKGLASRGRQNI